MTNIKEFDLSEKIAFYPTANDFKFGFYRKEDVKDFIRLLKPNFCPMCGDKFEDCDCGVPAFSVKWLREKLNLAGEKLCQ